MVVLMGLRLKIWCFSGREAHAHCVSCHSTGGVDVMR